MDANRPFSGFSEVSHTADIAIDVFAPDLAELFIQAALGLYHILGIRKGTGEPEIIHISMDAEDDESLLVSFLNELLYYVAKSLIVENINLIITHHKLEANISMLQKNGQLKDVKAATYNNLKIERRSSGLKTRIVFDI